MTPLRPQIDGSTRFDRYPIQDSMVRKLEWQEEMNARLPFGTRVRVLDSDVEAYVGQVGTVVEHDAGLRGEYPLVGVRFDDGTGDGFYDDELEKVVSP